MSVTQKNAMHTPFAEGRCRRCNTILPPQAAFCGACGARVEKKASLQSPTDGEITERYRLTSLVRRRSHVQLFLARDIQRQRPVAVRAIDLSGVDEAKREQAVAVLQQEYDLLRYQHIPDVMAVIEMRLHDQHCYTVAGWPVVEGNARSALEEERANKQLRTLHDALQSGIGRPGEMLALAWLYHLCRAVQRLHQHAIVIGDLDPSTIVLNGEGYEGRPTLMVSWLPPALRSLLPRTPMLENPSHFSAPETLLGRVEPRSDVYSLGALLYLLLTGIAPTEPTLRLQRPLRTPRELNSRVSPQLDALVMRALAIESVERFFNVNALAKEIRQLYSKLPGADMQSLLATDDAQLDEEPVEPPEEITVSIVPLRARLASLHLAGQPQVEGTAGSMATGLSTAGKTVDGVWPSAVRHQREDVTTSEDAVEEEPATHCEAEEEEGPALQTGKELVTHETGAIAAMPSSPLQRWRQRLTGILPAISKPSTGAGDEQKDEQQTRTEEQLSFFRRMQRFFLGEQQHATTAVALIETPLRVQPGQAYVIRIHLTGRDTPQKQSGSRKEAVYAGLSALVKDEIVHIEVRSALYHNYAYVVQRADVALPGSGYSAEVTIPMQPLSHSSSGRRERLHVFFSDELRRPLYEKPFVVEIFVSPLVQSGREGYNVLTIPV